MTETESRNNLSSGIEEIIDQGELLAKIIRAEYKGEGINFFTENNLSQQLAQMKRLAGYEIPPHVHLPVPREVVYTLETIIVRRGKVLVDFYNEQKKEIGQTILKTGDVMLLIAGGHGFTMLEDTDMVEVKLGPYAGDKDKERFEKPHD
jgi:hypothetical protein